MGASLSTDDVREIRATTQFTAEEIKRLYRRFRKLDKDNSGSITTDEFLAIPEFAMNPLAPRIVRLFNSTATDVHPGKGKLTTSKEVSATPDAWTEIGFKQFVETLAVFSPRADRASKLACMLCLRERASGDTRFPGMHVFNTYGLPNFRPTDAFRVFDVGGDGVVDCEELFTILKMMVGANLSDTEIRQIVERILGATGNGIANEAHLRIRDHLTMEDFDRILQHVDIVPLLTIHF